MTIETTVRALAAATLVGLGVLAVTLRRSVSLDVAEARAAAAPPRRDLRAELADRVYFRSDRAESEPADAEILGEESAVVKSAPQACPRSLCHSDDRGRAFFD